MKKRLLLLFLLLNLSVYAAPGWFLWPTDTTTNTVQIGPDGPYFDFPAEPETVNYMLQNFSAHVSNSVTAQFTITMDPGAAFTFCGLPCGNPGTRPPNTRFYLEKKGAFSNGCNWSDPNTPCQYRRWWSIYASQDLMAGDFVLNETLTPDRWSSVLGRLGTDNPAATNGFYDTLSHLDRIGLSYGGGSFYGHGVSVQNGNARFLLRSYTFGP